MKKNQFSEEQIIRILKEAEQGGKEVRALSRHHGITEQTFYRWRQKRSERLRSHRLRELEKENSRLKRIVAGLYGKRVNRSCCRALRHHAV
jgi:putative transposase